MPATNTINDDCLLCCLTTMKTEIDNNMYNLDELVRLLTNKNVSQPIRIGTKTNSFTGECLTLCGDIKYFLYSNLMDLSALLKKDKEVNYVNNNYNKDITNQYFAGVSSPSVNSDLVVKYKLNSSPGDTTTIYINNQSAIDTLINAVMVKIRELANKKYTNEIANPRHALDIKMNELLQGENSLSLDKENELDSSLYIHILWVILATSLLYVFFTKVKME